MTELLSCLVDRAAITHPQKQAFVRDGLGITYSELAKQSSQLANVLIEFDVKPGDRIGVFVGREIESAIAIYGILKAGGIYVPLDPNASATVNANIICDCNLRVIVTHDSRSKRLSQLLCTTDQIACVIGAAPAPDHSVTSISWQDVADHSNLNCPSVTVSESAPAYILYTSGTTGQPKGIVHTHHSGLSYARLTVEEYDLSPSDRIACHPPLHFDMSTFGFLAGPMACATTVIVSEADTKFPASISALIQDERISIWYSVPIVLSQLLSHGVLQDRSADSLRWVVHAGEPLSPADMQNLRSIWPHVSFSNAYGPTETNVCTVFNTPALNSVRESSHKSYGHSIPIGKPWGTVHAIVLANDMALASPGQQGELLIHSPTVMTGYWQRPALNSQVFVKRPGSETTYYRTGDLVREDEEGNLNFEGRVDRQVKIRGFRIELEGIEVVINSHPDIEESCAVVQSINGHVEALAAYVVTRSGANLQRRELLQYLKTKLPVHSVPNRIEFTSNFSRTSTGKLDRTLLAHDLNQ